MASLLEGSYIVRGDMNVQGAFACADGSIRNAMIQANTAISVDKTRHLHRKTHANEFATTVPSETRFLFVARNTHTVLEVVAGLAVANIGDSTITVNVKKAQPAGSPTTILSSVITLNSSQTARQLVAGTISVPSGSAGDVYEVAVISTVGTGTLGKGLFVEMSVDELY